MKQITGYKAGFYERFIKRLFDIGISVAALIILSPLALLCMAAIKLDDIHGSVFFKHARNGRNGEKFWVVKFRTMKKEACGESVWATSETLTKVGKIIRLLSLDEIPQFVTIISGKMSFIGPRPLPLSYYEWFSETERRRFNVRPGLTGLSQVHGRANLNWDERFVLDTQYADNISFLMDMKIFFRTFGVILSHKDVLPDSDAVSEDFSEYRRKQLMKRKPPARTSQTIDKNVYQSERMQA